jgi:plasmid stabilization system protein ParE
MPRGDKSKYTDKQKRQAEHIEQSYEARGMPEDEAERRAWATVNKESGGGNKSGSGRGKPDTKVSAKKGGERGVAAAPATGGPAAPPIRRARRAVYPSRPRR